MSKNKLMSESDVKKALDISDFRNLSKDKIIEFVSMIPNMDKEVALAVVNQFPEYSNMAKGMTEQLGNMCEKALKSDETTHKDAIEGYKLVLNSLNSRLNNEELSKEDKDEISKQMIEVADKIALKDTERKELIKNIVNVGGKVTAALIVVGAAILGIDHFQK